MHSSEKCHHVLHKSLTCKACEYQSTSQWGYREGNEACISCALWFLFCEKAAELEVLEIQEESDEIQDLLGRTFRVLESKESKGWCIVPKTLLDVWHEAGYLEIIYSKLLEICECGKVV